MQRVALSLVIAAIVTLSLRYEAAGQNRPIHNAAALPSISTTRAPTWIIDGKWTYRSYHNRPDVIIDDDGQSASKALSLLFGEGIMTLKTTRSGKITGTFDMGGNYVLDVSGSFSECAGMTTIKMFGPGRKGTPTEGWEYDYQGVMTAKWPNGINQLPAIVGSVFRAKPHGNAKAGYVASFIAVKQP